MKRDVKPVAARPRGTGPRRAAPVVPELAADIDRVIDLYCNELIEKGFDDPEYWWWPRAAWVDPNQLIVDGENGSLYRVQYSTNDKQEITFAAPIEVLEEFTDLAPAAKARVLLAAGEGTKSPGPVRVFATREESPARAKKEPEEGVEPPANNVGMDRDQLCEALGLPTTATDEEIDAATAARKAELAGEPEPEPTPEPTPEPEPEPEPTPEPEPAASALPEGMVAVPAEVWQEVQEGAAAGAAIASTTEETNRDNTINAALAAGKLSPSSRESMVKLHARDKDAFYNLLTASTAEGGLAPNLVPVHERGTAAVSAGARTGPAVPGGAPLATGSGDYVPPETMRALFGEAYVPAERNPNGVMVVGA